MAQDEYLDAVCDQLEQILVFSDSEEEDSEKVFCMRVLEAFSRFGNARSIPRIKIPLDSRFSG